MLARLVAWLRFPLELAFLLSGAKDFRSNSLIGNARLNLRGLHVFRKRFAHAVANVYRRRIAARLPVSSLKDFEAQGFLQLDDFLPEAEFNLIREEVSRGVWSLIEMQQPPAVTHRANLDAAICSESFPALARLLRNQSLFDWVRYAAGCPGQPLIALQRINSNSTSATGQADPQAQWHMDTFHSVGKAWLFLHDVGPLDGPVAYVPGSHRYTPASLEWERRQSITARHHTNPMHAKGSFRASADDLEQLSFSDPVLVTVRSNTLVIADTGGVHRREPSPGPTVRLEIYLSLRRNPYLAWCFPSFLGLPVVRRRWAGWAYALYERLVRAGRPDWIPRPPQRLGDKDREKLGERPDDNARRT